MIRNRTQERVRKRIDRQKNSPLRQEHPSSHLSQFPPFKPLLPSFSQRLRQKNLEVQYKKFLEVLKQLHVNIPLVEALEQMSNYVKFLKDILTKKRRLEEFETVLLIEECSAILQNSLPPKVKDPGSFTIPILIGEKELGRALCDLGASILCPYLSIESWEQEKLGPQQSHYNWQIDPSHISKEKLRIYWYKQINS